MRRFCLLTLLLLALSGAACDAAAAGCGATGCDLRVTPGETRLVTGDAVLLLREAAGDAVVVDIDGDIQAIPVGTTDAVGGMLVTVASIGEQDVRLLVAP